MFLILEPPRTRSCTRVEDLYGNVDLACETAEIAGKYFIFDLTFSRIWIRGHFERENCLKRHEDLLANANISDV